MRKSAFSAVLLGGIAAAFLISGQTVFADPNLISRWKFDEGSGTTAYDSLGDNDGTIYGATWTTGKIDGALDFDGTNDYIGIPDNQSQQITTDQITLSAWIILDANVGNTQRRIICKQESAYNGWGVEMFGNGYGGSSGNQLAFHDSDGTGAYHNCLSPAKLNPGQWYHIAVTDNAGKIRIYIDGQLNKSDDNGYGIPSNIAVPMIVGRTYPSSAYYFNGKIDDVRFYNKALSLGEVKQLYLEGLGDIASDPHPINGATGVSIDVVFSWRPGKGAASHDVYLGTDYNDVNDANTFSPEYKGNFDVNSYDPCGLELMTTYYWRVDEVNEPNLWKGNVWSFDTARPVIGLSATQFQFTAAEGGANPDDQILGISNSGAGVLNWETNESCGWLSVEPTSGSSTGEADDVNLSVDISGLAIGRYDCNLTVSDPNASNNPQKAVITLRVHDSDGTLYVPSEYSTIQNAINTAQDGDVVIIAPGTYTGTGNRNIDFLGKVITVRSTDPNDPCVVAATVIDCQNATGHRGFYFHSGEGADSIVSGLTIRRGNIYGANANGGGIYCEGSSPTIKNCTIKNNVAWGNDGGYCQDGGWAYGGGIYSDSSSNPAIINCIITNNTAEGGDGDGCDDGSYNPPDGGGGCGGGICICGTATIENCLIAGNTAIGGEGGTYEEPGGPGGPIYGSDGPSDGGGIYCEYQSNPTISNCTITDNDEDGIYHYGDGTRTIISSIIWGNGGQELSGYGVFNISYSDIEGGYAGTGNINADPCFVTGPGGDFYLSQIAAGQAVDSPCVDAGSDTAANSGMNVFTTRTDEVGDKGIVDMGYHYSMPNPTDIDGDGDFDFVDFAILASQWQQAPGVPSADIAPPEGDNIVDGLDLGVLAEKWLTGL